MDTLPLNSAIAGKTRELCALLLESPDYKSNVAKIETFFGDESAQQQYRDFAELGEQLQQKQHAGELTQPDVDLYQEKEAALREHPVAGPFLEAESQLNDLAKQISKHVAKTLELGRVPGPEDLAEDGCCGGGGCGCH